MPDDRMTDQQVLSAPRGTSVQVFEIDYTYYGRLVMAGAKMHGGPVRCVVEDFHGRLGIHSPSQLRRTL